MTKATTESYDEMVLEVEFTASSGTYLKICGITGVEVTRTNNITSSEVPDCDDETEPHQVEKDIRSREVSVSGTGVWALERNHEMKQWFYGAIGPKLNCRLRDVQAETNGDVGDIYAESGPAILASLGQARPDDKGVVTASIEIQFDGTPTLTTVAA